MALNRSPDARLSAPLALSQGDPSGIGPEIAIAAYRAAQNDTAIPPFVIFGDPSVIEASAHKSATPIAIIARSDLARAAIAFSTALPVIAVGAKTHGAKTLGAPCKPSSTDAPTTIAAIENATDAVLRGQARALVTNPICKESLYAAGFAHPGHTEFLGALAQAHYGRAFHPVMMLHCADLAVVPATIHVPLAQVPRLITPALLIETAEIIAHDLQGRFGLARPRLVFSGLNPHAGEGGTIGREEIEIIAPAIKELKARGIDAKGPFPADSLFHAAARRQYDVAICMTHDQALIPIKTLAFETAVNVTCGLPFIRTSPDHGVAYDIAGQGRASAASLIAALKLAGRLSDAGA